MEPTQSEIDSSVQSREHITSVSFRLLDQIADAARALASYPEPRKKFGSETPVYFHGCEERRQPSSYYDPLFDPVDGMFR